MGNALTVDIPATLWCDPSRRSLEDQLTRALSVVLSGVLLLSSAPLAFAIDLPRFDVRLHCVSPDGDARGPAACEHSEDAARSAMLSKWDSYPLQRRHFCVQAETIRPKGERSYVNLAHCLGEPNPVS